MSRKISRKMEGWAVLAVCMFCFIALWWIPQFLRKPDIENHMPAIAKALINQARKKKIVPTKVGSPIGVHENVGLWENTRNVVHVVNTRFMQHQHDLEHLGSARLDLFHTFTLPSIRQQTNQEFLWIIWTDKRLKGKVLDEIVNDISLVPNAVLLAAEQEKDENFREISDLDINNLGNIIIAGNKQLLLDYKAAAQSRLLIETNLDADDALTKNFMDSVQTHAVNTIGQAPNPQKIEVFCPERHVEWRYYKPEDEDHWKGHLMQFHDKNSCIKSGRSVAYHVEASAPQIKGGVQSNLQTQLKLCEPRQGKRTRRTQEQCTGKGGETLRFIEEKLHVKHIEFCPQGSHPCTDVNMDGSGSKAFGRPPFAIPSVTRTCLVRGTSDTIEVEITPSKYSTGAIEQSGIDLDVLSPNYMLSAVYLKALDGGNMYYWDKGRGGRRHASFATPHAHNHINHVDICVVHTSKICGIDDSLAVTPKALESLANEDSSEISRKDTECRRTLNLLNEDTIASSRNYFQSAVLMPRTPAAAGLENVIPKKTNSTSFNSVPESAFESEISQEHAWVILMHDFGIEREDVATLRENFEENMELILVDAMAGQCNDGFDCNESTKRALKALLQKVQRRKKRN